jgi:hypothetical protein
MVQYYQLGAEKRLNEIVMAGSHDAGITHGGANAKTQGKDIQGQADAGVRLFDLRVAAAARGVHAEVKMKTYHGPLSSRTVRKRVQGLQQAGKKRVAESHVTGTWGEELQTILSQAQGFVTTNPTEFLILKFDKCENWEPIAALCVQELGATLYTGAGNLNKKTLFDLRGKVIVVFTEKGLTKIDPTFLGVGGILGIKNLSGGGAYQKAYDGIQYYGKGGTDLTTRKGKSIQENVDKQLRLMQGGAAGNPDVMGMMYWTTTGLMGNIRARNKMMWQAPHVSELQQLWQDGLGQAVKSRIPPNVDPTSFIGGTVLKRFLPNIVMIDFASRNKCQTIFGLNRLIPTQLTNLERAAINLEKAKKGLAQAAANLTRYR